MQSTLKQQIQAINLVRNYGGPISLTHSSRLNDAASTIAAIRFIGEDKVYALPELLTACVKVCNDIGYNNEIGELLKKLKYV